MKLIKFLNDNKYIIIIILLIIYLFFIWERIEGFQVNERYDFKLSRLEDLMDKFIKKLLVSEKDCRGRFTKYSECDKKCGFNSVQTRKYEILKEAEKGGKRCQYKNGYTEKIDCYMDRCEIGDPCEENLDCESNNCNNGKCNEWAECSFNDLNMCDKTECKQLNNEQNFTNDEEGYYLYDNRINSCFFKTPAEIEDEEIQVYSYEYNSTAPIYNVKDCFWYQKKNNDGDCKRPKNIKLIDGEPYCKEKLMGPKPNPYNMDIACTQCILSGTPWNGSNSCDCSASGTDYENQYISSSYAGQCLKINTTNINKQKYYNCNNTTFIGYSYRVKNKAAGHAKWKDKYKHDKMGNSYDPCVSISDPRYADTSPGSFYSKILENFDGAEPYKGALIKQKYNGSATEFKDLKTAQNFCNNLIYKDTITGELSRCGFVPGIGYINDLAIPNSKQTMNASIVGNCNSAMTYNINYLYAPHPNSEAELGYQSWSSQNKIGGPRYGPRSSFPLKCSNELVSKDKVCPFSLDHSFDAGGMESSQPGSKEGPYFSGLKSWDNNKWLLKYQNQVSCSKYPKPFCNYMTYWDSSKNKRYPCYYDEGRKKCSASTTHCDYKFHEYCESAIKYYKQLNKSILKSKLNKKDLLDDINKTFLTKQYGKKYSGNFWNWYNSIVPCSTYDLNLYIKINGPPPPPPLTPPAPPKPPPPTGARCPPELTPAKFCPADYSHCVQHCVGGMHGISNCYYNCCKNNRFKISECK